MCVYVCVNIWWACLLAILYRVHVYLNMCVCMFERVWMCVYVSVCVCICACVHLCVRMSVCMYV